MRHLCALPCIIGLFAATSALAAGEPMGGKGAAPEAPQNIRQGKQDMRRESVQQDRKDGVIKPPAHIDPEMTTKPPPHAGTMPVIPPPTHKNGRKIVPK